jgi:hypothetical protein
MLCVNHMCARGMRVEEERRRGGGEERRGEEEYAK